MKLTKKQRRIRIKNRIRKIVSGTEKQPRLSVFRSNKEIYAQLVDDVTGKTLAASSSSEKKISKSKKTNKIETAALVGKKLAEKAVTKGSSFLMSSLIFFCHSSFRAKVPATPCGMLAVLHVWP